MCASCSSSESATAVSTASTTRVTVEPSTPTSQQVERCTANDLTATAEPGTDSAMGNTKLIIDVTNSSDRPCVLPTTPPTLAGVRPDGEHVPLVSKGAETYFGTPPPFDGPLEVGGMAVVWVGSLWPDACPPANETATWSSMLLGLPDGSTTPFMTPFDTKCGIDVSNFSTPR
ncbi:MAG: DUF4232 domain-containing protein [Ilumatobacteraceae bacterium]